MKRLITVTLLAIACTGVCPAASSVLSLSDNASDSTIIYPESFETDVKAMRENWYLKNYAVLDREADNRADVPVSDEVLIERLGKLSTVIEMPFNSVVKRHIMMYAERRRGLVANMLGMSLYYMPIFEQALDRYGLPMELKYLPVIESALNPVAVSRVGATGLWQFMLPTASGYGLEVSSLVDERRDPQASSEAAAKYLKSLYDIYGDWSLAIAAYNCGPGNVNKAIRRAGGGKKDFWQIYPFLPAETRGYVPAFIAANYIMTYYDKHNISPALARRPIVTDSVHVTRRVHFKQISDVMGISLDELRVLNPQYRRDLIPGDIRPYPLVLPSLQVYAYIANEDSIVNHDAALYARRDVVEPATGKTGSDEKGEYVEELVVKYHTVRRGETLSSIARKYGVTMASIRKANKIGKKVIRGKRLKINTYQRKYIPRQEPLPEPVDTTALTSMPTDSIVICPVDTTAYGRPSASIVATTDSASTDSAAIKATRERQNRVAEAMSNVNRPNTPQSSTHQERQKADTKKATKAKTQTKAKPKIHTVRRGESLYKIAKRYGITVQQLKDANGITDDKLQVGKKLKIPAKRK